VGIAVCVVSIPIVLAMIAVTAVPITRVSRCTHRRAATSPITLMAAITTPITHSRMPKKNGAFGCSRQ